MKAFQALAVSLAALHTAHGQLKVLGPRSLVSGFDNGMVYGTTATFGAPYYGDRVLGQLMFGETKGDNYCTKGDYEITPREYKEGERELVNIVLVRRGGCTFVTKTLVAQQMGAHAVVVVDKKNSPLTREQIQKIVMADDGHGHEVKIPSILVSREDGEKLIDAARQEPVIVELAWDIPRGQVVVMDFWMSSGSRESTEFLIRFQDSAETLMYNMQFVPHFHIFSLPAGAGFNHLCATSIEGCAGCKPDVGKFCAPDPDGPGPISGGDVANEDLRRLCIWNVTATKEHLTGARYSQKFWDYVVQFFRQCSLKGSRADNRFGFKCSTAVMNSVDISQDMVQKCVSANFASFLEMQIQEVAWSPQALRLNGWRYSGPLDPETVLKAVCSGYAVRPQECKQLLSSYSGQPMSWSLAGPGFSLLIGTCVLVLCIGVIISGYKRYVTMTMRKALREEVMLEVQTQMADYVSMEDKGEQGAFNRPALSF